MAAQRENLLSLGNLTGTKRNTFTKQREHTLKKRPVLLQADFSTTQSHHHRAMQLQQRWQELKERERKAKQRNRQLLQQFEEAQDTLREMLTLTATMKTIRTEYERYLKENSPRWRQQLKEQTEAAQKTRMEEYLRSCLKNTAGVTKSSSDRPLHSQGPITETPNIAAPQNHHNKNNHLDPNQDGSPHLPYMLPSWQPYPQSMTARFPIRAPYQPQPSSYAPQSYLPHPHPFQIPHLAASSPGHYPPGWGFPRPDYPWSWTAGAAGLPSDSEALWGHLYIKQPRPERETQVVGEEAETSRSSSSQRGGGGGSRRSHLSQELDVKPVRLSSGHAESSESGKGSSQGRKKKREKRGSSQRSSADRERRSSQESSGSSTAVILAAPTVAQSSESDTSSEKGSSRSTRRSGGLAVGSPSGEEVVKESSRRKGDDSGSHEEESQSAGEELESPIEESRSEKAGNPESGSQRVEEESGSVSIKYEKGNVNKIEKEERGSSEQSSVGEKDEEEEEEQEKDLEDGDVEEKERSQTDEEQEEIDKEDVEASDRKNTTEEEDETGAEEEMEEQDSEDDKNRGEERRKQGSASSQEEEVGEDESEGGEGEIEEDLGSDEEEKEESGEGEEPRSDEAGEPEEEGDSDSIIAPQENRAKKIYVIPEATEDDEEEEQEEEDGSKSGPSNDDSNESSDEDIEHLLAPKEPQKKEEKEESTAEKPKAICDEVEIFQVEQCRSTKTDHQSDSDEFDHFYD